MHSVVIYYYNIKHNNTEGKSGTSSQEASMFCESDIVILLYFWFNVSQINMSIWLWRRPPELKHSHTSAAEMANSAELEAVFTFLLVAQCICMHARTSTHTHTHTHNRDIMKHRDMETSDKTLQLILGLLPMNRPHPPPPCLPQLLGFLSLRRSRRSFCPLPHAANLSPLTQDFTLFKPSSTVPH